MLLLLLILTDPARAAFVLVYAGPGACAEGCANAAAAVAHRAGFSVPFVTPNDITPETLSKAAAWIQPGGDAITVARAISPERKELLREFVRAGGGYVGFCAGAFLADAKVDDQNTIDGLALLPGTTKDFSKDKRPMILPVDWRGHVRYLYFEDGATFIYPPEALVKVFARYKNGAPATVGVRFGLGRVVVSGPHPEAPEPWKSSAGLRDPDGNDFDLAGEMLSLAISGRSRSHAH